MIFKKAMELRFGLMVQDSKETINMASDKAMAFSSGKMALGMKENSKIMKSVVRVSTHGLLAKYILVLGEIT